jgi:hypothetical protein
MEVPPLILKMTTKNLLALYRAERKRMYKRGYSLQTDEEGEPMKEMVWINNSGRHKYFKEYVEYFTMLKNELLKRPHVDKKQKGKN